MSKNKNYFIFIKTLYIIKPILTFIMTRVKLAAIQNP